MSRVKRSERLCVRFLADGVCKTENQFGGSVVFFEENCLGRTKL